jgi:hypothetical protein
MAAKTIDPTLKKKIIRYLKNHSQNETARHFKISPSTVNGIANADPTKKIVSEYSPPKHAIMAHRAYAKADRLQVLNKFMGLVDRAMDGDISTADLRNISTALGTALDKFRLEEKDADDSAKGEVTDLLNQMKGANAPAA